LDPSQLTLNPEASPHKPRSYLVNNPPPGFVLNHEVSHDVLIGSARAKGKKADGSEYRTDLLALETIQKAREKWVNSGYKDDSGYFFVFETPEGYILAKKEKEEATTGVV